MTTEQVIEETELNEKNLKENFNNLEFVSEIKELSSRFC